VTPEPPPRADKSRRLTVLSPAERQALYEVPDFAEFQRAQYFAFTAAERDLAEQRKGFAPQLYCMVQIGYFKAKNAFFNLAANAVPAEDVAFLIERYFPGRPATFRPVAAHEQYAQRTAIAKLFGYRLWSATDQPSLTEAAAQLARRDVTPAFVLIELLAFLSARKIVRPGYATLQKIIAHALTAERARLERLIDEGLDDDTRAALRNLLLREETFSELAVLKQDAKNFGHRMMAIERQKRTLLAPIHHAAKKLLPGLGISQQNVEYYASLVHFYTIYGLRRMRPAQMPPLSFVLRVAALQGRRSLGA
jgi:Domain of unknown function (DUF4158)